jgi:hypothetical protein
MGRKFTLVPCFVASWCFAVVPSSTAEQLISTSVFAANVFEGPSVALSRDLPESSLLSIQTSGVVDLFSAEVIPGAPGLRTNAAGVFVEDTTGVGGVPAGGVYGPFNSRKPDPDGLDGSLLIGNNEIGFFPLFIADKRAGLGSSNPPIELITTRPVDNIFGFGLNAGTELELRVNDINATDNIGRFDVSIDIVPEPSTLLQMFGGVATALLVWRLLSVR